MPKGYWIGHVTVADPKRYAEYVRLDTAIIEGFGGRFIVRGGAAETREGASKERHVVIEFPDMAAARACYDSEPYREVARIRQASAETDMILVEGA